jgi:type VI secretion system secreted protein Hcp
MANTDYFLKIDGVEGESKDKTHGKEIDVLSWSWGEANAGSHVGAGAGAGKVSMNDFSFTMTVNKASPKLLLACANGQHIASAILTCRRAGKEQQEYLVVAFTEIFVTSYQTGGNQGDLVPTDSITLNFGKIEYKYRPQKPDGSLDAVVGVAWDQQQTAGG